MKLTNATQIMESRNITRSKAIDIAALLLIGALVSCAALAFVAGVHNATSTTSKIPVVFAPAQSTQTGAPVREAPQVVRFALYDVGIYPYEAHVNKGLVAVSIEDLSGGAGDVVVARETGAARATVGLVQHAEHGSRARSDLRLEPGRYQVYVADHPENQATLIVE